MARRRKKRIVSNGVKRILAYLITKNIPYKQEFRIKECRDKLPLPFDFAIFKDKNLVLLIEYNGIQHFKSVRRFGGKKALNKQQSHDSIKTNFCIAHNIPLLIINYDQDNIEELCEEKFVDILLIDATKGE